MVTMVPSLTQAIFHRPLYVALQPQAEHIVASLRPTSRLNESHVLDLASTSNQSTNDNHTQTVAGVHTIFW